MRGIGITKDMVRPPRGAEMVIGSWWSGWAWYDDNYKDGYFFIWRGQGDTGATFTCFRSYEERDQYIDGLEGDNDTFVRD